MIDTYTLHCTGQKLVRLSAAHRFSSGLTVEAWEALTVEVLEALTVEVLDAVAVPKSQCLCNLKYDEMIYYSH
jgi:hypothetical protein